MKNTATATVTATTVKPIPAAIEAVKTEKLLRTREAIARFISSRYVLALRPDNMRKWDYCLMLADIVLGQTR